MAGSPRKLVRNSYDIASRLTSLKVDNQERAGSVVYNSADQITSMKVGPAGVNQVTESYSYNNQTGLITGQKVEQGSARLLDLSYTYGRLNSKGLLNGKTGHVTKTTNKSRQQKEPRIRI